jgi:hypothetical protein
MADAIHLASRFVEVPDPHANIVPPVEPQAGESELIASLAIHSSTEEPDVPYRVRHRGYWFYVDDSDIESKIFLEAMVTAYSSRVGSRQAGDTAPQVVLPVGGG